MSIINPLLQWLGLNPADAPAPAPPPPPKKVGRAGAGVSGTNVAPGFTPSQPTSVVDVIKALMGQPADLITSYANNKVNAQYNKMSLQDQQAPLAGVRAGARAIKQTLGQVPAGLASVTVANSARPKKTTADVIAGRKGPAQETGATIGGYRPAIADVVPAFVGSVGDLLSATGLPTKPSEGSWLRNSMERSDVAAARTNKFLGITAPQDPVEAGLNAYGSILVPGPKLGEAVTTAGKVGKGLVELALPLRQTGLGEASKVVVPTAMGVDAGIRALGGKPEDAAAVLPPQPDIHDQEVDDEQNHTARNLLIAGGVLGTLALGKKAFDLSKERITTAPFADLSNDAINLKVTRSQGGPIRRAVDKTATNIADSLRPIRSTANESLTPDAAKLVNWKTDNVTNTAIGAQVQNFLRTGNAPFASRKYVSPLPLVESASRDLNPQDKKLVGTALLYASSLDDYKRTGVNASFSNVSPEDKQRLIDFVTNNPTLAKYFHGVKKSYADLAQYEVDGGLRSADDFAKFRAGNPNYVHMSKDEVRDFSNTSSGPAFDAQQSTLSRAERKIDAERAGIQDNARNPIDEVMPQWGNSIRLARINDYRKTVLNQFAEAGMKNADGVPIVRKLPAGEAPKSLDKIHTVFEDGKVQHYQVNDPMLDSAFRMPSRTVVKFFDSWRQLRQSLNTGIVGSLYNGFMFAKSPLMETQAGAFLRAPNMRQGLLSEVLGANLGPFDFTQPFTSYSGAMRYAFDEYKNRWASNLTEALMRPNQPLRDLFSPSGILKKTLGEDGVTALRDKLAASYENSHKAFGDQIGAFSHNMRGSPDTLSPMEGLATDAPAFTMSQGVERFQNAVKNGEYLQGVLAGVQVPWLAARTSSFGQMLSIAQDAMRNGFAYSNIAANRGHLNNLDELASAVRRASIDTSRHGSSKAIGAATSALEYLNISLQTAYGLAHRFKENPASMLLNTSVALGSILGLHYASMSDPEVRKRNALKTPEQRTASLSLPGGMEMPIEQSMRPTYGAMTTLFDHLSGAMSDDQAYDPSFFKVIDNWFETNDDRAQSEAMKSDLTRSLYAAVMANSVAPDNSAVASTLLASQGLDPRMTSLQGQPAAVRTQTLSGFDDDKTFAGSMMSADKENLITTILGSFAENIVRSADEAWRANGQYGGPVDWTKPFIDRWKDQQYRGASINKPLFGNYESTYSVNDTNYSQFQARRKGIDAATNVYNRDVRLDNIKPDDPELAAYIDENSSQLKQEYQNTPVAIIGLYTKELSKQLRPLDKQLNDLYREQQKIAANTSIPLEERNKGINAVTDKRKALYYQKMVATRLIEDQITADIGEDFTYDGFDPNAFKNPPPAQ